MIKRFFRWILIGVLAVLVVLMVIGITYEWYSRDQADRKYLKQGAYLKINGHRMHYEAIGTGNPTVVFESGLGASGSLAWSKVQPEVAKFTRTFSYDRAGVLKSERGNGPKTGKEIAEDLHELLKHSGQKAPYILVGQSFAGYTLRSFIARYPEEVAGIVFVDVSHPQQLKRFPELSEGLNKMPPDWVIRMLNDLGIVRKFYKSYFPSTTKSDTINTVRNDLFPSSLRGILDEKNAFDAIAAEADGIRSFGNIPLVVITGTGVQREKDFKDPKTAKRFSQVWLELQQDLLQLSTVHQHILATKSGHQVNFDEPEVVVKAIDQLVQLTRPVQKIKN